VGKNLCAQLKNIADGKARWYDISGTEINVMPFDIDNTDAELDEYCSKADFVFNLAGVNRPQDTKEFMEGNFGFASKLLDALKRHGNTCPVMISSSTQAALDNPYGESKRAGEELIFQYGEETGARVLVYRFPNLFGKWCRPNYNSAVATFCNNIANGLPIQVNDPSVMMRLVYIDDLVDEMMAALVGKETREGRYCRVPVEHEIRLGEIVDILYSFRESRVNLEVPNVGDAITKKLYSTYLSYLPAEEFSYPLKMNVDDRGSFTEMLRSNCCGQVSINISKPGIVKGEHWHNTKTEKFCVVSGRGVIRFRDEREPNMPVIEKFVSGDKIEVVDVPTGYTHNIENLGDTDMVTIIWCNECFDPGHPETYFDKVKHK
jgi:UDP-2-acetamido-2,6-beta-L-arabino-hexul-4-ose reductase